MISIITFILLAFLRLLSTQETGSYEVRELSLSRPYPTVFATSNSHWDLTGNTLVTDKFIRLTSDAQGKAGGLWSNIPIVYPDWEIHVQFHIHGESKGFFGDGLVIWYVKEPRATGSVFGYRDRFNGLGIFLDTYGNRQAHYTHAFPYVYAIVNNGTVEYGHDNDGANQTLAGCEAAIRGRTVDTLLAIRYENDRLTVSTDFYGTSAWTECFSINNVLLPTNYYLGFSAATGDLTDNHDIINVHTYALETGEERKSHDRKWIVPSAPVQKLEDIVTVTPQSGWSALKIFFVIIGILVVIVAGVAFYYYRQNRRRGPRFY